MRPGLIRYVRHRIDETYKFMLTLLLIILLISVLILVHEWGHFYSARRLGVRVEEFGFGFPPKIFSRVKDRVRYSFNLFPFGGFVKIFGEHGEGEGDPTSFTSRPVIHRFVILAAGVFMNLVLAWFLFSLGLSLGLPQIVEDQARGVPVSIIGILPGSPAEKSGLKFGDKILEMRFTAMALRIEEEKDVRDFAEAYRGEEITLVIKRGREIKEIKAIPRVDFPEGEGPLGIALARLTIKKTPWYLAPIEGLASLGRSVAVVVQGFGFIFKELLLEGKTSVAVSGPIGIFFFAQESSSLGLAYFLQFVGMLSVNLAVLNFLPIPALDGGRILFLALEKLKGRRIDPKTENLAHTVGFALLIAIMILVTYKDIARIF